MAERESLIQFLRYVAAGLFVVAGIGVMALYPTVLAVCILPGWRTFFEAFAVSYIGCLILFGIIVVAVTHGE